MSRQVLLKNPNRFTVPVTIRRDNQLVQVNILPKSSITIGRDEMTPAVRNIVESKNHLLVMKRV